MTKTIEKLIFSIKKGAPENLYVGDGINRVQVDDFISRIAKIYEKIRNAIDYKEDHLLRKSAIFRILQRRLLIKLSVEDLSEGLIKELIRAGYLDNDWIPVQKVEQVQKIIEKYIALYNLSGAKRNNSDGQKLFKWLIEICACEIEEAIMPPLAHRAMVEFTYQLFLPEIKIVDGRLSEKEKELHIYVAIYRALVKSDLSMINFLLLKYYYPQWTKADPLEVMAVAKKIRNLKKEMQRQIDLPLADKLLRLFKKYTFAIFVLRDIIASNPKKAEAIFSSPADLELYIRNTCNELYKRAKTKLRRSIVRVTVYIFLTKMLLALILEFPYEYYVMKQIVYLPLIINALFPPLLMVFIGTFIRVPSKSNTEKVVVMALDMVYKNRISGVRGLTQTVKQNTLLKNIFVVLYVVLFVVSFGALISILWKLHFSVFSIAIFLMFLSLVSFFGIKLRYNIRELQIFDRKEGPLMFLANLFSLPFLNVGHWLSVNFSKINIFVFILDFIIEAPFKVFLEVIEDWVNFLKEKKEEIYSRQ